MVENVDTPTSDFVAQITALVAQVQKTINHFMVLEDENATLRVENHILQVYVQ